MAEMGDFFEKLGVFKKSLSIRFWLDSEGFGHGHLSDVVYMFSCVD